MRAGYGVQANAYNDDIDADNSITSVSGGLGVRLEKFYVDLALIHSSTKDYRYQPYTFSDGSGPVVDLKDKTLKGLITVGFTF